MNNSSLMMSPLLMGTFVCTLFCSGTMKSASFSQHNNHQCGGNILVQLSAVFNLWGCFSSQQFDNRGHLRPLFSGCAC